MFTIAIAIVLNEFPLEIRGNAPLSSVVIQILTISFDLYYSLYIYMNMPWDRPVLADSIIRAEKHISDFIIFSLALKI